MFDFSSLLDKTAPEVEWQIETALLTLVFFWSTTDLTYYIARSRCGVLIAEWMTH